MQSSDKGSSKVIGIPQALALLGSLALTAACGPAADSPAGIVEAAISRHGGELFEDSRIRFDFRGVAFESYRNGGAFLYQRAYRDALGRGVVEAMDNSGTRLTINGEEVPLDPTERARIETDVHSVIYFGLLPHRLRDPAVQLRDLGPEIVAGESYHRIEVTFEEEGGGADSDARFVHWIHEADHTLDYFAYQYSRDGGGARFRRAVNPREIGGLLVQDFENFGAIDPVPDIEEFARLMEEGSLNLLSVVALEDVEVSRASSGAPAALSPPPLPESAGDGLEIQIGIDQATYAPGAQIGVVLRVGNPTAVVRTIDFATSQRFDFAVLDEDGRELMRWSEDQLFLQVIGEEEIAPGESVEFEAQLAAPADAGSYHLMGTLTASDGDLSALLPFRVGP